MPKTPEEALAEAMTTRVSQTLGAQLMQIVQLQAQNEALAAENAALTKKVAALETYGKEAKAAFDAVVGSPAEAVT